jgi:hypothetical protein
MNGCALLASEPVVVRLTNVNTAYSGNRFIFFLLYLFSRATVNALTRVSFFLCVDSKKCRQCPLLNGLLSCGDPNCSAQFASSYIAPIPRSELLLEGEEAESTCAAHIDSTIGHISKSLQRIILEYVGVFRVMAHRLYDVRDTSCLWCKAICLKTTMMTDTQQKLAFFHYFDWSAQWDEC